MAEANIEFQVLDVTHPWVVAHLDAAVRASDPWSRAVWISQQSHIRRQRLRLRAYKDSHGYHIRRHRSPRYFTSCEVSVHDGEPRLFSFVFD